MNMLQDVGVHLREAVSPVQAAVAITNTSQAAAESAVALALDVLNVKMGKSMQAAMAIPYLIHTHVQHVHQGNTVEGGFQGVAPIVKQENSIQTLALQLKHLASNVHLESTTQTQVLDL